MPLQAQGGQGNRYRNYEAVLYCLAAGAAWARFDRKSTGRKRILGRHILKKIMEWTRWDPSRYGFEPASWQLDMVNEMIRRETGRHAKPRTLRRILRRLGLSYPSPGRCRTRPPLQGNKTCQGKGKRTISGYAVLERGRRCEEHAGIRVAPGQKPRRGYRPPRQSCSGRLARTGSTSRPSHEL